MGKKNGDFEWIRTTNRENISMESSCLVGGGEWNRYNIINIIAGNQDGNDDGV